MANEDSFTNIAPAAIEHSKKDAGKSGHSKSQKDIDKVELNEDSFQEKMPSIESQVAKGVPALNTAGKQSKKGKIDAKNSTIAPNSVSAATHDLDRAIKDIIDEEGLQPIKMQYDPKELHPMNPDFDDEYVDEDDPGFDTYVVNEENFVASC